MARVYLSFLGLGSDKPGVGKGYTPAVYELMGTRSSETEFVQVAEHEILIQKLALGPFDKTIIVATEKSRAANFDNKLEPALRHAGAVNIMPKIISEDMSPEGQWKWLDEILPLIEHGDHLTVDLTHGYRAIPIVFSTAMNFLQKARNVTIDAVYYGAYDANRKLSPIVDMKDFCIINEWAEAVSRLVEDADARKMAKLAELTPGFQVGELNDEKLITAFEDLTNVIRNVDVHHVAEKAETAIRIVREKEASASVTGKILLRLVLDKFTSLASGEPASGRYDRAYFHTQLEIIKLLLEHKLYMQAYTVMREFIGSIGMIEVDRAKVHTCAGRDLRKRFAEVFVCMVQFLEPRWTFKDQAALDKDKLLPYYAKLRQIGVEPVLRGFASELVQYRNGFDHAWTLKSGAEKDVEDKGTGFLRSLKRVIQILCEKGIL
ncbi:MAG: TIGR02221 family CRISPR-associated protein [Thermodesulfobacteriota bacterium]